MANQEEEPMIDSRTAPYAALFLRLSLSFFFFAHLYRKFAIIGFDNWWSWPNAPERSCCCWASTPGM
jgi:hypothetical protein